MSLGFAGGPSGARLAQEWRERISRIARNLTDFNDSEACVRTKGRMSDASRAYTGRTQKAAREAVVALDALWQDYLLLSRVVDEADGLAKKSSILANHDAEVAAMLTGPSIKLPVVSIPVQKRGLLDGPDQQGRVEPSAVLDSMIKAFDVARTTVAEIDQAESALNARASALRIAIQEIRDWSVASGISLGDVAVPDLDDLERDPLGALDRIGEAEQSVRALQSRRDELAGACAVFDKSAQAARDDLEKLRAAITEAKAAIADSATRFEGPPLTLDPSVERGVGELETWLETLRTTRAAGRPKAAIIGLDRWQEFCACKIAAARAPVEACNRALAAQADVAGRLRALRAKGLSLAAKRPLSAEILSLEDQAKKETRRTPYRPLQAEAAVAAYEKALAAAERSK